MQSTFCSPWKSRHRWICHQCHAWSDRLYWHLWIYQGTIHRLSSHRTRGTLGQRLGGLLAFPKRNRALADRRPLPVRSHFGRQQGFLQAVYAAQWGAHGSLCHLSCPSIGRRDWLPRATILADCIEGWWTCRWQRGFDLRKFGGRQTLLEGNARGCKIRGCLIQGRGGRIPYWNRTFRICGYRWGEL